MPKKGSGLSPTNVFRRRLRDVRQAQGTQRSLAAELARVGSKLDQSALARVEKGSRGVSLDDAFAISTALSVSPLNLVLPESPTDLIALAPYVSVESGEARAWMVGAQALPGRDQVHGGPTPTEWVDRRVALLEGLVDRLAEHWGRDDLVAAARTLDLLAEEVGEHRAEIARQRRARRR